MGRIEHVGSTALPGMKAKLIIFRDIRKGTSSLIAYSLRIIFKGEYEDVPFRWFFKSLRETSIFIEVPQIDHHLALRNFLRCHLWSKRYSDLKQALLEGGDTYLPQQHGFSGYALTKDSLIREINT